VEFGTAKAAGLAVASLENKAGELIQPSVEAGQRTLSTIKLPPNLRGFFPDPEGKAAYSIITYSWLLLNQRHPDEQRRKALHQFVRWSLKEGQRYAAALGYIPLPPEVVAQATAVLDETRKD
jgi:phosphate transport system substrate-binding protein